VLGLKFAAYWLTGSVALYSDALESTINVLAAGAAFFAIGFSARPADSNHPYGHYKAEYFSAVFEGGLPSFTRPILAFSRPSRSMRPLLVLRSMGEPVSSMGYGRGSCYFGVAAGDRPRSWQTGGTY